MTDRPNVHVLRPGQKQESQPLLTDGQQVLDAIWEALGKQPAAKDRSGWKGDDAYKAWFAENKETLEAFVRSIRGVPGADGDDAYKVWLRKNKGSLDDFLESLRGEPGEDGEDGEDGKVGKDGAKGDAGDDAYKVWLRAHQGSEADFLASLKGDRGSDGEDAFRIWLRSHEGTEADFLRALKGEPGKDGKGERGLPGKDGLSAYQLWRKDGNKGTIKDFWDWLARRAGGRYAPANAGAAVKGDKGDPGEQADPTRAITCIIDGGGNVIPAGLMRSLPIPFDCTITGWTIVADVAGDLVIDLWKDTFANYPPTLADSITAAAKPALSGVNKAQMVTLTGWNTAINAGDVLAVYVESAATITQATFSLIVTKTLI